jgi:hypothetical protein
MIIFHPRQSDCARRASKNENAGTINFTSQIASSNCTVAFTKCEKFGATIFTSRRSRLSLVCIFRQRYALPLSFVRFLRLANGSSKNRRSPQDGRAMTTNRPTRNPARCLAHYRTFAGQLPGCGKCNTAECPRGNLQDNSQVGELRSRNVRVTVHAITDATYRETSRKMIARNFPVTS